MKAVFAGLTSACLVVVLTLVASTAGQADDPRRPEGTTVRSTPTGRELAQRFHPGAVWDGIGRGNLTETDAKKFSSFPLAWVGSAFAGYNLQSISHTTYDYPAGVASPNGLRAVDEISLVYGECEFLPDLAGRKACPVPFQIIVNSVCYVRPQQVPESVKTAPAAALRGGALMQEYGDGHVDIWTGRSLISIDGGHPGLALAAAAKLQGLGPLLAAKEGEVLPAPDFTACPDAPGVIPTPKPRP